MIRRSAGKVAARFASQPVLRGMIAVMVLALVAVSVGPTGAAAAQQEGGQPRSRWEASPPRYDQDVRENVEIEMSDGVTLRADVYYPIDKETGEPVEGRFPVVLSATPYSKDSVQGSPVSIEDFTSRGYLRVMIDVRGTGVSGGAFELFGPREQKDYGELVHWAADLPRANGKVGMVGGSYLGYNQYFAAAAAGPNSPLKALFPVVTAPDIYRDLSFPGGLYNVAFNGPYQAYELALNTATPALGAGDIPPREFARLMLAHLAGTNNSIVHPQTDAQLGGDGAYNGDFWRVRRPERTFDEIVRYRIPVFAYNAWFDIAARGNSLVYSQLQNAWAGRPMHAPMRPDQPVTGRYQAVLGPYSHFSADNDGFNLDHVTELALQWFDRFLKGNRNGIDETRTPLHMFQVEGARWVDERSWPVPNTKVKTYYLRGGRSGTAPHSLNDGQLTDSRPQEQEAGDTLVWDAATNPCSRTTDQSLIGGPVKQNSDEKGLENACVHDNRALEAAALTYTTKPVEDGANLAGPMTATLFATATTPNTEWVATVSDVAPDGSSRMLSHGALLGSARAVDEERSWYSRDGKLMLPYHPYTRGSHALVSPGKVTRYDVELSSVFARIDPGHRIRLAIRSTNTPGVVPLAKDVPDLIGGKYDIHRNRFQPSHINFPFIDEQALKESPYAWGACGTDCD